MSPTRFDRSSELPSDIRTARLARVPYATLRKGVASTCKAARDLVASEAFYRMRAEGGWDEWAVFVRTYGATSRGGQMGGPSYLMTLSSTHRAAPLPLDTFSFNGTPVRDEIITMESTRDTNYHREWPLLRAFDARRNRWRTNLLPAPRTWTEAVVEARCDEMFMLVGGLASSIYTDYHDSARVDAYDPAQNAWVRFPDLPTRERQFEGSVEISGKLYVYGPDDVAEGPHVLDRRKQLSGIR